ncbi:MAG: CAP domain-containing protein, partial [Catenulispora sp.]|nr:CAP domain-containing protein [Catenulispora sp.]
NTQQSSAATSASSAASTSPSTKASMAPAVHPDTSKPSTGSKPSPAASTAHNSPPPPPASSTSTAPTTPPSTTPTSSAPGQVSPEDQVLNTINQARAAQGLPPLTRTAGLDKSAAAHTSVMASGCGLSHQCPGEPGLGARETAAGVSWSAAGENIGDGGPVANTNDAIAKMAVGLTNSMLAEQPPNDGHRRNILSSTFHHLGISIFRDRSGTVWMTQDFSD